MTADTANLIAQANTWLGRDYGVVRPLGLVTELRDALEAAEAERDRLRVLVGDGIEAFRLTREYVGEGLLPESEGWSWWDWCERARAALAESGQ